MKFKRLLKKILKRFEKKRNPLSWLRSEGITAVLDIGANVGQFAIEIREALPEADIYSFEPLKGCFEALNQTMREDTHFQSYNFALGEKKGEMKMNKSEYEPSSSILSMANSHKNLFPHTIAHTEEIIKVEKLDDVFSGLNISGNILIKVDVQGYEDKVIAGGKETFKKAKVLIIETSFVELYTDQPLFDNIYNLLRELGFVFQGAVHEKKSKDGKVIFQDSVFVKSDR